MKFPTTRRRVSPGPILVLAGLLLALAALVNSAPVAAQGETRAPAPEGKKPFQLPFQDPPGPSTWLFGQAYGNTTGAYRQRKTTYGQGQGVHFGLDFSAPCKTTLVSLGDGIVAYVDDLRFGSAPHNLLIQYPNGYVALYGHLYEPPRLKAGQAVKAGEPVALSGDPDGNCRSRPHLHLEIRDASSLTRAFNPINLIDADWDSLAMMAQFGRGFEKDLDDPRKWQFMDDQPEITFGLPLINDFPHAWPSGAGTDR